MASVALVNVMPLTDGIVKRVGEVVVVVAVGADGAGSAAATPAAPNCTGISNEAAATRTAALFFNGDPSLESEPT
ncbi:hypothetical protein [Mycobacterium sp. MS1601]|uniref:hypothetical protein n=1 Tax=Mycobacterium sp. MS1601 TaxID=1936029 RepID=UPI00178CAF96|nr:hypothetical protein [Mycobacterium sp. MS1601]